MSSQSDNAFTVPFNTMPPLLISGCVLHCHHYLKCNRPPTENRSSLQSLQKSHLWVVNGRLRSALFVSSFRIVECCHNNYYEWWQWKNIQKETNKITIINWFWSLEFVCYWMAGQWHVWKPLVTPSAHGWLFHLFDILQLEMLIHCYPAWWCCLEAWKVKVTCYTLPMKMLARCL